MRRLDEVEHEIETLGRAMAKLVIQQDDIDHQLGLYDRRRTALENEKLKILSSAQNDTDI